MRVRILGIFVFGGAPHHITSGMLTDRDWIGGYLQGILTLVGAMYLMYRLITADLTWGGVGVGTIHSLSLIDL